MPAVFVGECAKHPEAWNRFPASRSTVVMANRHLSFRLEYIWPIKNFDYNSTTHHLLITYVTHSGLVSVPAAFPMPIMTHPLMVVNS